jgi:hypothetical protein
MQESDGQHEIIMQLLSINTARAIWLFTLSDLNPRGRAIGQELIDWLKGAYSFKPPPSSPQLDTHAQNNITFSGGKFKSGHEADGRAKYITVEFSIYNDGLVATTRSSTKDADEFLSDVLTSAAERFGLAYNPNMVRNKVYLSELDIKLEKEFNFLNPQLQGFAEKISSRLGEAFEFSGVAFSVHPHPSLQYSPFRIERKINTLWSENRYFSSAPLHTDDHITLLEEFEQKLLVHH